MCSSVMSLHLEGSAFDAFAHASLRTVESASQEMNHACYHQTWLDTCAQNDPDAMGATRGRWRSCGPRTGRQWRACAARPSPSTPPGSQPIPILATMDSVGRPRQIQAPCPHKIRRCQRSSVDEHVACCVASCQLRKLCKPISLSVPACLNERFTLAGRHHVVHGVDFRCCGRGEIINRDDEHVWAFSGDTAMGQDRQRAAGARAPCRQESAGRSWSATRSAWRMALRLATVYRRYLRELIYVEQ